MLQSAGVFFVHAFAAGAENALPRRQQKAGVKQPGSATALVFVAEVLGFFHVHVGRDGVVSHGQNRSALGPAPQG